MWGESREVFPDPVLLGNGRFIPWLSPVGVQRAAASFREEKVRTGP